MRLASLYYDYPLTNREAFREIKKYVDKTRNGQPAKVRMNNVRRFKVDGGSVRYVALKGGKHMEEPKLLAKAALSRKNSEES